MIPETQTSSIPSHPQPKPFWHRLVYASLGVHLAIVLLLAGGLRAACFLVSSQDPVARQMDADSIRYLTLGLNLAEGKGFGRLLAKDKTSPPRWTAELCRPPVYPAIIAFWQLISGDGRTGTIVFQNLLGLAVCATATIVARRSWGSAAGLFAGLMLAADAQGVALSNLVLTEAISGVVMFFLVMVMARALANSSPSTGLLVGLLVGAAALIRTMAAALPLVLGGGWLVQCFLKRNRRGAVAALLLLMAGTGAVGLWIVRNGLAAGEYTFSSLPRWALLMEQASRTLEAARHIPFEDAQMELTAAADLDAYRVRELPLSAQQNSKLREVAFRTIWENPAAYLRVSAVHTAKMVCAPSKFILKILGLPLVSFGTSSDEATPPAGVRLLAWMLLVYQILYLGILYLAAIRTIAALRRGFVSAPILNLSIVLILYTLALSAGAPGEYRYRWPVIPLVVLVASASLAKVRDRAAEGPTPQPNHGPRAADCAAPGQP